MNETQYAIIKLHFALLVLTFRIGSRSSIHVCDIKTMQRFPGVTVHMLLLKHTLS